MVLFGIAHRDCAKASAAAASALKQFRDTKDFSRHHPLTLEVLRDRGEVAAAIEKVSKGSLVRSHPVLCRYVVRWRFVRVSKLSVERLLRLGALQVSHAPFHTGPYVSLYLRGPEVQR